MPGKVWGKACWERGMLERWLRVGENLPLSCFLYGKSTRHPITKGKHESTTFWTEVPRKG